MSSKRNRALGLDLAYIQISPSNQAPTSRSARSCAPSHVFQLADRIAWREISSDTSFELKPWPNRSPKAEVTISSMRRQVSKPLRSLSRRLSPGHLRTKPVDVDFWRSIEIQKAIDLLRHIGQLRPNESADLVRRIERIEKI